jgi:ferredoxin
VKVRIDSERCQGHGRCYSLSPELFDSDDYGDAVALVEGELPTELESAAQRAAANCPEHAVIIEEA